MSQPIVLASGNQGKIAEFSHLLKQYGASITPQRQLGVVDPEETGLTFIENAILKARHASAHTGLPALADDSGLVVANLQGAPGIYSARYAGVSASDDDNINKLLAALTPFPQTAQRQAYFICVLALLRHANDPSPIVVEGRWHGFIATQKAGEQGFGYDPVFFCPQFQQHAAELDKTQKSEVSHRAQAIVKLKPELEKLFG